MGECWRVCTCLGAPRNPPTKKGKVNSECKVKGGREGGKEGGREARLGEFDRGRE